jgi:GGDEF domain-containing protein
MYRSYNLIQRTNIVTDALQKSYITLLKIESSKDKSKIADINQTIQKSLESVESWLSSNRGEIFEINFRDILTDYLMLSKCWDGVLSKGYNSSKCDRFYSTIQNSIESKKTQELYKNRVSIYIAMFSLLVLILSAVKAGKNYVETTIEQNMIYDSESRLYSYYYCMDVIKKLCSQSDRLNKPLSAIFIELASTNKYSIEEKKMVIEGVGEYLTSTIRLSDIACRYRSGSFLILMQNTPTRESIPVNRISEGLTQHIREFFPDFEIIVTANIRTFEEDCSDFVKRATTI